MHAASVNPEPGSNSLKNSYLNPQSPEDLNPFSELFILASLLLLSFTHVFDKIAQLVLKSLLVLFNFQ